MHYAENINSSFCGEVKAKVKRKLRICTTNLPVFSLCLFIHVFFYAFDFDFNYTSHDCLSAWIDF